MVYIRILKKMGKDMSNPGTPNPALSMLKVQAYERLITFAERIGFPSLADRLPSGNLSAQALGEMYISSIKSEFEHQIGQQIYVSEGLWKAICDLKDQQIFIIQQLLTALSPDAPGSSLEKTIGMFLDADPMATMQTTVKEAIRHEAQKQMEHY